MTTGCCLLIAAGVRWLEEMYISSNVPVKFPQGWMDWRNVSVLPPSSSSPLFAQVQNRRQRALLEEEEDGQERSATATTSLRRSVAGVPFRRALEKVFVVLVVVGAVVITLLL